MTERNRNLRQESNQGITHLDVVVRQNRCAANNLKSFSCPHCGALAHQYWFQCFIKHYERDERPRVYYAMTSVAEMSKTARELLDRLTKNIVTHIPHPEALYSTQELANLNFSRCHSCEGFAVWVQDKLIYPATTTDISPNEDMPADVRQTFEEAATIVDLSPRGAAALLRLAIQMLMPHLGEEGKNLNDDIASLVKKGLEVEVQQALDVVRVIGNNAVHPGVIDLKDDKATALSLFELVNIIVERRIAAPKRLAAIFKNLPPDQLAQIEKRDGKP